MISMIKEGTFMNQKLNIEKAEILISQLPDLVALNLAHNHLNNIPRGLPPSLVALDLSFNEFKVLPTTYRLRHLVELKLTNNQLDSIVGLSSASSLEYLDVSCNRLSKIRGLEMCSKLKLLHAENNNICSSSALRSLSLNTMLIDLSLRGNPLCTTKTYKISVMAFASKLKTLDGKVVSHRSHKLDVGYTDSHLFTRHSEEYDDLSFVSGGTGYPRHERPQSSSSRCGNAHRPSNIHSNERVYIDGWSTGADQDPFSVIRHRSPVPWRNPPQIVPRDRKGNPVMSIEGVGVSSDHHDVSRLLMNNSIQSIPSRSNNSFSVPNPNNLSYTSSSGRPHHRLSSPNTSRDHHNYSPPRSSSSSRRGRSLSPVHHHQTSSAHRSRSMATGNGRPGSSSKNTTRHSHDSHHHSHTAVNGTSYRYDYSDNNHSFDPPSTIRANRRQPHSSPGRSIEYGTQWSSPSLQRKHIRAENNSIMENVPLSRGHGHAPYSMSSRHSLSHSRSLLNDSNSSMNDGDRGGVATMSVHTHPHHSHHQHRHVHNAVVGSHDVASYGPGPVEDNEEIYLAADMNNDSTLDKISLTLGLERPLDPGDNNNYHLEQLGSIGSRMTAPGPGSDVSSALAFLEDMWHEELIAQAKSITMEEQQTQVSDNTPAVSSTLQNRSALLRAIYNAERLRERKMSEQDEERKRQPSALTTAEVDWDHHHSGGKTPPYHRMNYHKAGMTAEGGGIGHRQGIGGGHMYGSSENSSGTNHNNGSEDERYDKILSRAQEYANGGMEGIGLTLSQHQLSDRPVTLGNNNNNNSSNNNNNNNSPTQPTSTSSSYKKTIHEDRRSRSDVYHTTGTGVAAPPNSHSNGSSGSSDYASYEEDGGVVVSGSQEDQRKYGVPLPVLPTLNRSNTPPESLKSRNFVRNTGEQENDETGMKHAPVLDNNVTIHTMLKDMHRNSFRDDTLIDDFDELEKLLITSQEIDDNDNDNAIDVSTGSVPTIGTGNSSDEIARLRGVMQAIMNRRKESIELLQKSISTK